MTSPTLENVKDEARKAIMEGKSTPIRAYSPRQREHLVKLNDGKTIHVIYDRTIGEVVKLVNPTG